MNALEKFGRWLSRNRPWCGAERRCASWRMGPFNTDWRCVLIHNHADVEGLPHIYEPDLWPGGDYHHGFTIGWRIGRKDDRRD